MPSKSKESYKNSTDDNKTEEAEKLNNFFANVGRANFKETQKEIVNENFHSHHQEHNFINHCFVLSLLSQAP